MNKRLIFFVILTLLIIGVIVVTFKPKDFFFNIRPTNEIDPEYVNLNDNPTNYYQYNTIGDALGPDLNCNTVSKRTLMKWIENEDPNFLYEYVYRYDPSININNAIHAPRVLKMLLRNLPENHTVSQQIMKRCPPMPVRIH